jgi:hypothetical protein
VENLKSDGGRQYGTDIERGLKRMIANERIALNI